MMSFYTPFHVVAVAFCLTNVQSISAVGGVDTPPAPPARHEITFTIPKEIREGLHMKTGDRMTFTLLPDGTVLMRVKNKRATSVAGRLFKKGRKALPVEDLSR